MKEAIKQFLKHYVLGITDNQSQAQPSSPPILSNLNKRNTNPPSKPQHNPITGVGRDEVEPQPSPNPITGQGNNTPPKPQHNPITGAGKHEINPKPSPNPITGQGG